MTQADPGLQPQRTALAWKRTALAVMVNALVVLRDGAQEGRTLLLVLGWILLFASVAVAMCGRWRSQQLASHLTPTAPSEAMVAGLALLTTFAALTGVLAMLHP